ncbi:MFS transporter [Diaphorobacter sp. HDW4A]|uniref:MFS transporter n=1 Tax=Diaphorobacter sp. HDW4A TaxID=2714924 RepID=UPI00140D49CC|nr:MFS transporter [Diaphorobacter sp. HDW4A]QIL83326.1 MFS transporter [Diaphorobacter sp. HDW4A]
MKPTDNSVNVQSLLNTAGITGYQWTIYALCFFIVLLDGFDTAMIGYIAPSLVQEWGVSRPALGPVLSAALFGLAAGAISAGPMADRLGRKRVLIGSVLVFGVACLASSHASGIDELTIWRFVTGLGLGAAMPNAVTLTSEYCPESRRSMLTNAMFCGFPLGAALGGFLAAWMIPNFGWRSVLMLGGVAPLVLGVALFFVLPESVRYMVIKRWPVERIRVVLERIAGDMARTAEAFHLQEVTGSEKAASSGIAVVLSRQYRVGSVMLWLAYFMGLVVFYALMNWMPILFKDAGIEPRTATLIAALFPLGGVGAIFFGWLMDRYNANRVIALGYALTAVSIWAIGQAVGNVGGLMTVVFIAGTIMNTAQSSMPALAAAFYPTQGRATGVAWMLGIGRFGGIAGSFLVAELTVRHLSAETIFTVVALPGLVAMVALLIKQLAHPASAANKGAKSSTTIASH